MPHTSNIHNGQEYYRFLQTIEFTEIDIACGNEFNLKEHEFAKKQVNEFEKLNSLPLTTFLFNGED